MAAMLAAQSVDTSDATEAAAQLEFAAAVHGGGGVGPAAGNAVLAALLAAQLVATSDATEAAAQLELAAGRAATEALERAAVLAGWPDTAELWSSSAVSFKAVRAGASARAGWWLTEEAARAAAELLSLQRVALVERAGAVQLQRAVRARAAARAGRRSTRMRTAEPQRAVWLLRIQRAARGWAARDVRRAVVARHAVPQRAELPRQSDVLLRDGHGAPGASLPVREREREGERRGRERERACFTGKHRADIHWRYR
jgi:hypothetical protein